MASVRHPLFIQGLKDAVPIAAAYFPIAITFGVVGTSGGIPWAYVILISVLVYAGAAQFMLVSLVTSGVSPVSVIATLLLVNFRHFLYGTALGPAFSKWPERRKWVAAFGLTDEVFAVTSSRLLNDAPAPRYQFTFTTACYLAWVSGTVCGVIIGQAVPPHVSTFLSFALPALFLAILFTTYRLATHILAAVSGALCAILATQWGLGSFGMLFGAVIGATIGACVGKWNQRKRDCP